MKEVFSLPENNTYLSVNTTTTHNINATILQQQQLQRLRRQQFIEQEELEIMRQQQSQEKQRRLPDLDDVLSETEIISMENKRFMSYPIKKS